MAENGSLYRDLGVPALMPPSSVFVFSGLTRGWRAAPWQTPGNAAIFRTDLYTFLSLARSGQRRAENVGHSGEVLRLRGLAREPTDLDHKS